LVEGGSEINAEFLRRDLVDELFLTLAPKIRLGRDLPTYAGGDPLPPGHLMNFDLLSCQPIENEVFLRYRRRTA
ncbi:MAG: dihydrofolate reductase family protein, partial [Fimbriimonadaceae bacterium]